MADEHHHFCKRNGCMEKLPCKVTHGTVAAPEWRCALHHVRVHGAEACPWCDGAGSYLRAAYLTWTDWVPCTYCNATGARAGAA